MTQLGALPANFIPVDGLPEIASRQVFGLFRQFNSIPFVLVEPWGNYGDQLLWRGAEKLANLAGVQFQKVSVDAFLRSDYPQNTGVYIHGGGGIHPLYPKAIAAQAFLKSVERYPVTILGPQTVPPDAAFLKQVFISKLPARGAGTAVFFARETTSHTIIKSLLPGWVEPGLDHDTALNLTAADVITAIPPRRFDLYAIRADKEAITKTRRDLMAVWTDPIHFCFDYNQWVALHNQARQIVTNRLHSAVLGAILGVPTTLLPNSYHKNRSVWEYSLQTRGVTWGDEIRLRPLAQKINAITPVRQILEKAWAQRFLRVFVHRVRYKNLKP